MKTPSEAAMDHAGLSEEEIAALESDDDTGTDDAAETGVDDSDGGSAVSEDAQKEVLPQTPDDDDVGAAADLSDEDKLAAAAAAEETPEDETPAAPSPAMVDTFAAQLAARGIPEDFQEQLTQTEESIEAIDKQLEDGEIEYAEHMKINRELTAQLGELNAIKREAEFVAGNNELIADQQWGWEVDRFKDENPTFQNPVAYGALRGALEELYAVEENAGNSYRWFLQEAATSVADAFGTTVTKDTTPSAPATPAKGATEDEIKADLKSKDQPAPPQTLAEVPASNKEPEQKDEFSVLDDMDGMELEEQLSKMPKSKVDQYLNSRDY
jgi:hypothetical protein